MKNVFLSLGIFILSVTSFTCYSQETIEADDLIGWWMSEKEYCDVFFWRNASGELQVQQISNTNGWPYVLSEFEIEEYDVFIKSSLCSKDGEILTTALNRFKFIDDKTLECLSTDEDTKEIKRFIYSKMK